MRSDTGRAKGGRCCTPPPHSSPPKSRLRRRGRPTPRPVRSQLFCIRGSPLWQPVLLQVPATKSVVEQTRPTAGTPGQAPGRQPRGRARMETPPPTVGTRTPIRAPRTTLPTGGPARPPNDGPLGPPHAVARVQWPAPPSDKRWTAVRTHTLAYGTEQGLGSGLSKTVLFCRRRWTAVGGSNGHQRDARFGSGTPGHAVVAVPGGGGGWHDAMV